MTESVATIVKFCLIALSSIFFLVDPFRGHTPLSFYDAE